PGGSPSCPGGLPAARQGPGLHGRQLRGGPRAARPGLPLPGLLGGPVDLQAGAASRPGGVARGLALLNPGDGTRLMTLPRTCLYSGKDEPLAEQRPLRAGPLEMVYEEGDLRYVRLGRREILRRVYVAVRDRNWGTVPLRLSRLRLGAAADSFQVTYEAEHR